MSNSRLLRGEYSDVVEPAVIDAAEPRRREIAWQLVLLAVLLISYAYVWWHLDRGWVPYDDGALAQSADRVLQGQWPHRDFDELYTGGQAWMNAAAFRLFGTSLWTLRLVLFAFFVAWVPAIFYVASRFVRWLAAAGVTLLAVVWSLPNYSAPMASWYNLFFATFGVAALFRYLEDRRMHWLAIAGLAGGLSFLMKVIGLYYVAGVLLFLVFHAHALARSTAGAEAKRGNVYATFVSASLLLFVAALYSVVRRQLYAPEFVQFFVPGALLAAFLIRNEWTQPAGPSGARFALLARPLVPFLAGVALPVMLFLLPYAWDGALGAFVNGAFVLPMKRFGVAVWRAQPLTTMLALLPFGLLVALSQRAKGRLGRRETVLLALLLLVVLFATGSNGALYRMVFNAARNLLPVLAVIGVLLLSRERAADGLSPLLRARTMLLLAVTALCGLVQFPFVGAVYFLYVAPLVALTALSLYVYHRPAGMVGGLLVAFFATFAVLRVNSGNLFTMGLVYVPIAPTAALTLERGGLEVYLPAADVYNALVPLVRAHARGGYTWASPDTPEIYFLTGLKNPTRSFFEFFDDSTNTNDGVLRALDAHGVTAIVLNARPKFSRAVSESFYLQLAARYPFSQWVGPYQLRWRE